MLEKLIPLKFPPGFANSGTAYQQKGRWLAGSLVRFFRGNIQPVGGWLRRTLTGTAITGTPSAVIGWQTNDGSSYLAIGTSTGIFVVTSANVVYNITPTILNETFATRVWQLDVFGSYLVGVSGYSEDNRTTGLLHIWNGDITTIMATPDTGVGNTPVAVNGVVATPERFLVLLRGSDPQASATQTTPTALPPPVTSPPPTSSPEPTTPNRFT